MIVLHKMGTVIGDISFNALPILLLSPKPKASDEMGDLGSHHRAELNGGKL